MRHLLILIQSWKNYSQILFFEILNVKSASKNMQALDFELIICSVQFLDELYLLLFNYDVEQKIDFM